jgi:hypothetical protein
MALRCTLPLIPYFPLGFESVIDPLSFDPDRVQRSVNVPEKAPLYRPSHVPARFEES